MNKVLWLDGIERKIVEEIGTSNAFFFIGDEVITPPWGAPFYRGLPRLGATFVERLGL
jgi:branched-chain amino acid aminotransferase